MEARTARVRNWKTEEGEWFFQIDTGPKLRTKAEVARSDPTFTKQQVGGCSCIQDPLDITSSQTRFKPRSTSAVAIFCESYY